ncbi:MAG: hypothetical protein PHH77_00605 [Victivallaceae bacterium]|nr:hypothetical protein [Victivallaceae bacterium]
MIYHAEFFEEGPWIVAYKGTAVGVTAELPRFRFEPGFYESRCDRSEGEAVCKIIAHLNLTVSVNVRDIAETFAGFSASGPAAAGVVFRKEVLRTGGELRLTPLVGGGKTGYRFLRTVLISEAAQAYRSMDGKCLKLDFEVHENPEGVLLEKFFL